MATITIKVNDEIGQWYKMASPIEQEKFHLIIEGAFYEKLLNLSLSDIMDAMSDEAERNGLTSEILERLLSEE